MTGPLVVGYAGMTHLGINSAVAAAAKGFTVVGYDPDHGRVAPLARGVLPVVEPDLPEQLAANRDRLTFTADTRALAGCDLVYVAPDVPTDDQGASDLAGIAALIDHLRPALRDDTILVVLSQVPPGFTRALDWPTLDRRYYQVETLVFGQAMARALHPERFIIGAADPAAPLPSPLAGFLAAFECPLLPMRYESAELAKISINMCLVASVTTANTIAELCERIGADWSEIAPALRLDRRIGQHAYLAPGLGIAGGNLERDLATFCRFADAHGTDARTVRAWQGNSRYRRDWVLRQIYEQVLPDTPDPVLALLGLAYKADTASTKNSPAVALLGALAPFAVRVYDPVVPADAADHPRIADAGSALAACDGADTLLVMTPWQEFRALPPSAIAARLRRPLVIDPYGALDGSACRAAGLRHLTLGRPAD